MIDGDPLLTDDLTIALRNEGHGVRSFRDGDEAVEAIETALEAPRMVILDAVLPGMSGREVLQRIRRGTRAPDVPVFVITATGVDEGYFAPLSILGVLRKPIAMDEFLSRVAAALPRRKGRGRKR